MLKEIFIKNLAIIDELRVVFASGFQVLTGDSGAGKSILVEAIGLILGDKPDSAMVRDGASEALVEAIFDLTHNPRAVELLQCEGLSNDEQNNELVIKRLISREGKHRLFINHQVSTVRFLQKLALQVLDVTGQHDFLNLLQEGEDLPVLDAFLPDTTLLTNYRDCYKKAHEAHQRMEDLQTEMLERTERLEWIEFQWRELAQFNIQSEAEWDELKATRETLKRGTQLLDFLTRAQDILGGGKSSVIAMLRTLLTSAERQTGLEVIFPHLGSRLQNVITEIEDIAFTVSRQWRQVDQPEMTLEQVEEKLFSTSQLLKKYGPTVSEVIARRSSLEKERARLLSLEDVLPQAEKTWQLHFSELREAALQLSSARRDIVADLEKQVRAQLTSLLMPQAQFQISITNLDKGEEWKNFGPDGIDQVTFLLSPNPGLTPRPLNKVASGGETSRLFLALKSVLASRHSEKTFIFDEIDSGISGRAVERVGQALSHLSERGQVLCITHHAPIAGLAAEHFLVEKTVNKKQTITRVRRLNRDERIGEMARLLGGEKITQANLDSAQEMLRTQEKNNTLSNEQLKR